MFAAKDPRYYESIRWDMISMIPATCKTFLDAGCGEGVTGKTIKQQFQDVQVTGIEINPQAANIAREVLDCVILGNLESAEAELGDQHFDCILFGDILEHLVDPWYTLQIYRGRLTTGGYMLLSLPNIQHYSIILGLIRGNWTYRSRGLLDQTHLRFFTYREILKLLEQAGLAPVQVKCNFRLREQNKYRAGLAEGLARLLPFLRPYFVFQYIILAGQMEETIRL